jgi:hypothetical protein
MAFELKEGQGTIFKNRRKEKETHPDWSGELKLGGKIYYISMWDKESEKAGPWFSVSTKEKTFKEIKEKVEKAEVKGRSDFEDEIPFMRHEDYIG